MSTPQTDSRESMRDWPQTLKLNAASCRLALALYYAKAEVYGCDGRHFEALRPDEKAVWVSRAAVVLKGMQPEPIAARAMVITGLGPTHRPVIGSIGKERA